MAANANSGPPASNYSSSLFGRLTLVPGAPNPCPGLTYWWDLYDPSYVKYNIPVLLDVLERKGFLAVEAVLVFWERDQDACRKCLLPSSISSFPDRPLPSWSRSAEAQASVSGQQGTDYFNLPLGIASTRWAPPSWNQSAALQANINGQQCLSNFNLRLGIKPAQYAPPSMNQSAATQVNITGQHNLEYSSLPQGVVSAQTPQMTTGFPSGPSQESSNRTPQIPPYVEAPSSSATGNGSSQSRSNRSSFSNRRSHQSSGAAVLNPNGIPEEMREKYARSLDGRSFSLQQHPTSMPNNRQKNYASQSNVQHRQPRPKHHHYSNSALNNHYQRYTQQISKGSELPKEYRTIIVDGKIHKLGTRLEVKQLTSKNGYRPATAAQRPSPFQSDQEAPLELQQPAQGADWTSPNWTPTAVQEPSPQSNQEAPPEVEQPPRRSGWTPDNWDPTNSTSFNWAPAAAVQEPSPPQCDQEAPVEVQQKASEAEYTFSSPVQQYSSSA